MDFNDINVIFNNKNLKYEDLEKQLYDCQQLIKIAIGLSSSLLDSQTLIESIIYSCMSQMHVLGVGMFIPKSYNSTKFTLDNNYIGFEPEAKIKYEISLTHKIVDFLNKNNQAYTLQELQEHFPAKNFPKQISSLCPSLIVPLKIKNHLNGILLLGDRIDENETNYTEYERSMILTLASLAALAINNTMLIEQSTTDSMTNLKLKSYFYTVLADNIESTLTDKKHLCVLMLDIDFFKKFNDTYGHDCGDFVLQKIAKIISKNVRSKDLAARYGGEEFVVMLSDTATDDAFQIAERIRSDIEKEVFVYNEHELHVTISIGLSTLNIKEPVSALDLVKIADQALYKSKNNGRNQVSVLTS